MKDGRLEVALRPCGGGLVRQPARRAGIARGNRARAARARRRVRLRAPASRALGARALHLLGGARTQHTTLLAPDSGPGVTLCAPLDSLPFASDSIDAIFLPHTLELVEDPYAVLREAERVLCAEGCLMICGFNPLSGWGARRLFAQYFRRPAFPPADAAHALRAAAARLDGAARF